MTRRHGTSSAPAYQKPSSSSRPQRRHHHDAAAAAVHRASPSSKTARDKDSSFGLVDGVLLALVGTLTLIDRDLNGKTRRRGSEGSDDGSSSGSSSSSSSSGSKPSRSRRDRSPVRRASVSSDDGGIDERYYEYGPLPGSEEKIRAGG